MFFVSGIIVVIIFSGFLHTDVHTFVDREKRHLTNFSGIDMAISGKLYYTQGNSYNVEIEASEADLERIDTEVHNGTLKIIANNCRSCNFKDVRIYVTSPEMNEMRVSGSGSMYAENDIQTDNIELRISGSGKIELQGLQASDVSTAISGSGDLDISKGGNVNDFEARISGSGSVDAENLKASRVDAKISGSGSCKVHAVDKITAKISGSGNIYYHGRPTMDVASSGSGKVKGL